MNRDMMNRDQKNYSIEERDGALCLPESVTFNNVTALYATLRERREPRLVLDWSRVKEADSAAVSLLLAMRRRNRGLRLRGLNPRLQSLIALYGVQWVLLEQAQPSGG